MLKRIFRKFLMGENKKNASAFMDSNINVKKYLNDIDPILKDFKILQKKEDKFLNSFEKEVKLFLLKDLIKFCDKSLFFQEKYKYTNLYYQELLGIPPKIGILLIILLGGLFYYYQNYPEEFGWLKKFDKPTKKTFKDVLVI